MLADADRPMRWEPRVLWSQVGVFGATAATEVRLDRNHFRNSEDEPYILTHMLIAPVGVPRRRGGAVVAATANALRYARVWVQHPDVRKIARQYQFPLTFRAEQVGMPRPMIAASPASSVYGAMSWMFERPVRVPPMVTLVVRMTAARRSVAVALDAEPPYVTPVFYQENPVNCRQGPTKQLKWGFENTLPGAGAAQAAALGCAFDVAGGTPPFTVWNAKDFYRSRRQDPALIGDVATEMSADRTGASYLTGVNFLVNQLDADENTSGAVPNAPLGNTIGVAIGSSMGDPAVKRESPWWRGYCPMSLCCPTMNDIAIIHRLPEPLRLQRGQAIDVAVELCRETGMTDQTIGVSFVGYTEQEA